MLLSAACEVGALLGGVSSEKRTALRDFGYHIGMAFQLTDDLLDYTSTDSTLGKDTGRDLKEGKVTLPLIHALKSADRDERSSIEKDLTKKTLTKRDIHRIKKTIEKYGGLEYTSRLSIEHVEQAKALLHVFPAGPYRNALLVLADYIVARES